MRLRKFENKDIPYIYEWMSDPSINCYFRFDAQIVSTESIAAFITTAQRTDENLHLACVDDTDTYLGTISLKHINHEDKIAEYAISFRACAQGTGAARFATQEILYIAFKQLHLEKIYLNVLDDNKRAISFYEKLGFVFEGLARSHIIIKGVRKNLCWYSILSEELCQND